MPAYFAQAVLLFQELHQHIGQPVQGAAFFGVKLQLETEAPGAAFHNGGERAEQGYRRDPVTTVLRLQPLLHKGACLLQQLLRLTTVFTFTAQQRHMAVGWQLL